MGVKKTSKGTKKFTEAEKLAILKEANSEGVKVTLAKYELYPATYYYWKRKLTVHGKDGLGHRTNKEVKAQISRLEKENEQLKILLGEKELESALKDELIKKKYGEQRLRS
jgi:putative transposase